MLASTFAGTGAWSTAAQTASLQINNQEFIRSTDDFSSIRLIDDGGVPTLEAVLVDKLATYWSTLATQQPILLWTSAAGQLFSGIIQMLEPEAVGPWVRWHITAVARDQILDHSPIVGISGNLVLTGAAVPPPGTDSRPAESDQARIQYLLAYYGYGGVVGSGGKVQQLAASLEPASFTVSTGLRAAIEQTLAAASTTFGYHVDPYGVLHTYSSTDATAPYAISDVPDYSTTIPAVVSPTYDGSGDLEPDAVWVNGATAAGSGLFWNPYRAPNSPPRTITVDASSSATADTALTIANRTFSEANSLQRVTVEVRTGGNPNVPDAVWSRGMSVQVTNSRLGLSAVSFPIVGVRSEWVNGKGDRHITLQLGAPRKSGLRFLHGRIVTALGPMVGARLSGKLGGIKGT